MTTMQASEKKKVGHTNERHFAEIIGGDVVKGTHKNDVIDQQVKCHPLFGPQFRKVKVRFASEIP